MWGALYMKTDGSKAAQSLSHMLMCAADRALFWETDCLSSDPAAYSLGVPGPVAFLSQHQFLITWNCREN